MEDGPGPDLGQTPATAITVGSREPPAVVALTGPQVFPTDAGPSRLSERAGSLRGRQCLQVLRRGREHRAADPTGEMTSAEIGSTKARVVPVVESHRAAKISTRTSLATGAALTNVDENLGITINQIRIGVGGADVTIAVNRLGEGVGVLVTEIQAEDEDVHKGESSILLIRPFLPHFPSSSLPSYLNILHPPSIPPFRETRPRSQSFVTIIKAANEPRQSRIHYILTTSLHVAMLLNP